MPFASCAISVSDVTVGTKMEAFSRIGTKSGKNKTQGLKQKLPENVETKSGFFPKIKKNIYIIPRSSTTKNVVTFCCYYNIFTTIEV